MQRTKIVDTIGPASSSPEILRELALIGMNVARINRSHGTLEECEVIYRNIRDGVFLASALGARNYLSACIA